MTEVIICNDACSSLAVVRTLELPRSKTQENQSLDCSATETDATKFVQCSASMLCVLFWTKDRDIVCGLSTDLWHSRALV